MTAHFTPNEALDRMWRGDVRCHYRRAEPPASLLLALASVFVLTGCAAPEVAGSGSGKDRGVYTTVAVPGQHLDLPASGYLSYKHFAPGQNPAAVIVGYGFWNGTQNTPEPLEIQLVELPSQTVLVDKPGSSFAGKATVIELPIRKGGDYQLKLLINGKVNDTWDFTVDRPAASGTEPAAVPGQTYAQGAFGVSIESSASDSPFSDYDNRLIDSALNAVMKESKKSPESTFAQVPPGLVTIAFKLDETGQVSEPQIIANTLTEPLGQFFLSSLQHGAPYRPWPAALRATYGAPTRPIKMTFRYD